MKRFITAEQANTSVKLPLYSEDGKDYYLMILSVYSNEFKLRKNQVLREAAKLSNDGAYDDQAQIDLTAKLAASTVSGWYLPIDEEEYSSLAAENLMKKYPQICDAVDSFSANNENYLKKN
jgi:hypothetical protein